MTLREDLGRRDLTVNALAEDARGRLIDYYGGRQDLQHRVLRHVSPAFAEDPLRILRVARFAARYADLDFRVAPETLELMRTMVAAGAVDHLVAERVWQELVRALATPRPSVFFLCLRSCGALARVLPEVDRLWGVPQPARWHPEIDTGEHVMMVVDQAVWLAPEPEVRFAALVHDLGKADTAQASWPAHHGHERRSAQLVEGLCARLRAPNRFRELAEAVALYHGHVHRAAELKPKTLLKVLEGVDALRHPERFGQFLLACEADFRGRKGFESRSYPQAMVFRDAWRAAAGIDRAGLSAAQAGNGAAVGRELRRRRLQAIAAVRRSGPAADHR